jgi:hypothetical protein
MDAWDAQRSRDWAEGSLPWLWFGRYHFTIIIVGSSHAHNNEVGISSEDLQIQLLDK